MIDNVTDEGFKYLAAPQHQKQELKVHYGLFVLSSTKLHIMLNDHEILADHYLK